ncbi:MAG: hypothetical protein OXU65_02700 [Deltaproteobacteria bacterium]|nr:hypothetical protein [Deltaproteobacteria bacterium]
MMLAGEAEARALLAQSLRAGRLHSAYIFAGGGEAPRQTALWFARALACTGAASADAADAAAAGAAGAGADSADPASAAAADALPCESCPACRRSRPEAEPVALDGAGKSGPLLRHVGNHSDLVWVERGAGDTRLRIGQIRAVQNEFRLRPMEGGRRAAIIADAEWLNQEAQNSLLRLLEEPPPATSIVLVTAQPAGLLATVRSRCQRVRFPAARMASPLAPDAPPELRAQAERLAALPRAGVPKLLDWAEDFRGPRAPAAASVTELLATAAAWLHDTTCRAAESGESGAPVQRRLAAWHTLQSCRKALAQRNANPQMVAERALFALRNLLP